MQKVIYKSIRVEGFQSFGSSTIFSFDLAGINLVKGSNGVGKSTLFNALLWCEYGHNLKKSIETWEDCRPDDYRGTRVIVSRTVGEYNYLIARHKGFKGQTLGVAGGDRLMIFKKPVTETRSWSGEFMVHDDQHKSQMQDSIVEQLGIDLKTYMNSIFFGQRVSGLIDASNSDKRDLFERLFDVEFVNSARENAKKAVDLLQSKISSSEIELSNAESSFDRFTEDLNVTLESIKNFEADKKARVDSKKMQRKELAESSKSLEKENEALRKEYASIKTGDYDTLSKEVTTMSNDLRLSKESLESIEDLRRDWRRTREKAESNLATRTQELKDVNENCPVCKAPLNLKEVKAAKAEISKMIKIEEQIIKDAQVKCNEILAEMEGKERSLSADLEKLREKKAEIAGLESTVNRKRDLASAIAVSDGTILASEKRLEEITKDINELGAQKQHIAVKPEDIEARLEIASKTMGSAAKEVKVLTLQMGKYFWWVKTGFGSSGLKSFVFNAMLGQLNSFAAEYAARLGFGVEFTIDMSKASKPFQTLVYQENEVRDYLDLSGGQKQRVDMVIGFAMHDLIAYKSDINILVMDEVLEGLDNEGVETAFDLIRRKAEKRAVYIITHNDIIDSLQSKTILIESDELGNSYIAA